MAEDSALVLVGPDDTVDTVIAKIRDSGTKSVELLVAEGAPALQTVGALAQVHTSAAKDQIQLLLITSDAETLNAARLNQVEALGVKGASVVLPPHESEDLNPYATRRIPRSELFSDDEVLRSLDNDMRAQTAKPSSVSSEDEAILASLDDFSDALSSTPSSAAKAQPADEFDDFAAELDAWGDLSAGDEPQAAASSAAAFQATAHYDVDRPRVRPEDIALSDDELRSSSYRDSVRERERERERELLRERERRDPTRRLATSETGSRRFTGVEEPRTRPRNRYYDDEQLPQARRRSNPLMLWLPVFLIGLLLLGGAIWLMYGRVTVTVKPPIFASEARPFNEIVLPLSTEPPADPLQADAVQAIPVQANVSYSVEGTVTAETVMPRNFAQGVVTIRNSSSSPYYLPAGTELIGFNPAGQEVRFVSNEDVSVPPATTADTGAQIVTQRGEAQVAITARQPGTASNVDANTITQIAIQGQAPTTALIEHGPIGGGDEQPVRVVTEQEVNQLMAQLLDGLYNQAKVDLQAQAQANGADWTFDGVAIWPDTSTLSITDENRVFDLQISPGIGEEVALANPVFTMTASAPFSGLAVPTSRPILDQAANSISQQLIINGLWENGLSPKISSLRWDGSRLLVDGALEPTNAKAEISAKTRSDLLDALRGKSYADAQAILEQAKQEGKIGDYSLPQVTSLPNLSFQLNLQVDSE